MLQKKTYLPTEIESHKQILQTISTKKLYRQTLPKKKLSGQQKSSPTEKSYKQTSQKNFIDKRYKKNNLLASGNRVAVKTHGKAGVWGGRGGGGGVVR